MSEQPSVSQEPSRPSLNQDSKLGQVWHVAEKLLVPLALGFLALLVNKASNDIAATQLKLQEKIEHRQAAEAIRTRELKYLELFFDKMASPDPQTRVLAVAALTLLGDEKALILARVVQNAPGSENLTRAVNSLVLSINEKQKKAAFISKNIEKLEKMLVVNQTSQIQPKSSKKTWYRIVYSLATTGGSNELGDYDVMDLIDKVVYRYNPRWYTPATIEVTNRQNNFRNTKSVWGPTQVEIDIYGVGTTEPIISRSALMKLGDNERTRF